MELYARSVAMKWQSGLVVFALLATSVSAQGPLPASPDTLAQSFAASEAPCSTEPLFPTDEPAAAGGKPLAGNHNFPNFINWISNPLQNIDPRAVTAIYPIFGSAWFSSAAPLPDGDMQLYGPALTVALSERFAVGLNQGGFAAVHLNRNQREQLALLDPLGRFRDVEAGGLRTGWLNLGGFAQYTLVQDVEDQFLLTGGLRWEAPCGSHEVFQGHGPVHLAPYLTAGKEFGEYHVLATVGYEFPAGPGNDSSNLFYADVHFDRRLLGWLYPLVEFNCIYHTTSVSFGLPAGRGFIDFNNFESTGNIVTLAAGANAVLVPERLEMGAVYLTSIATQNNFGVNGLLVKMVLRF
jgi:hypothetical protein